MSGRWLNIPYAGHTSEDLVKGLLRKLKRYVKPIVILRINYIRPGNFQIFVRQMTPHLRTSSPMLSIVLHVHVAALNTLVKQTGV